ncbi:MAG: secondary thiamine-phosphate synthase enzyme YjbQ [Gammaproteobacteria bacterium]
MIYQGKLEVVTQGRGSYDVTQEIQQHVAKSGAESGVCQIFVHHTSASLMLCENVDPEVRADLERFMARLAPDGDPLFRHTDEGPDDMPAHIRSILTSSMLGIPIEAGICALGTWQGVYLWEHRQAGHRRKLTISVLS